MAVELRAEIRGMTREQYERAVAQVGDELRRAPGFVAHAAGPIDGGYRVVEIWGSREELERFLQQTILPMAQRIGLPPFQPQILPVDNVLTR